MNGCVMNAWIERFSEREYSGTCRDHERAGHTCGRYTTGGGFDARRKEGGGGPPKKKCRAHARRGTSASLSLRRGRSTCASRRPNAFALRKAAERNSDTTRHDAVAAAAP